MKLPFRLPNIRNRRIIVLAAILVPVFLIGLTVNSFNGGSEESPDETTTQQVQAESDSSKDDDKPQNPDKTGGKISEIAENPQNFFSEEVSIEGDIAHFFNNRIFTLTDKTTGKKVYIITPRDLTEAERDSTRPLLGAAAVASITGTVRVLQASDVEEIFKFDFTDESKEAFDETIPTVIIKSLTIRRPE